MSPSPRPFPRGPGATPLREQTVVALLRWWWGQPFEYDWVHAYAESHAWLRVDRLVIAAWYVTYGAVGAILLFSTEPSAAVAVPATVSVIAFLAIALWWWTDHPWPTERHSLLAIAVTDIGAVTIVLAAPSGTAALALTSLYVLPGFYVMFVHSPPMLMTHLGFVFAVIVGTAIYVFAATDTSTSTIVTLTVAQVTVCSLGFVLCQIALTFLRADARNSFTDPLTGLLNRRGLYEAVAHSATRYPSGAAVCVLMIDIDNFKSMNDRHGHNHGDDVLTEVARILTAICDSTADALARTGGDEFVAVAHLDADGSTELANLLCSQIARLTAETRLTVSVGLHTCQVDTWPPSDTVVQALLTHADIALYNAKRAGGNTVSTHQ